MIPVDIDNFNTKKISWYFRENTIMISYSRLKKIPKEVSNIRNLKYIELNSNYIKDISGLFGCKKLKFLCLSFNKIVDISGLSKCKNLTSLYLSNNKIVDISALSRCTSLKELDISNNRITDISALSICTSLTELDIWDNRITDISTLSKLKFSIFNIDDYQETNLNQKSKLILENIYDNMVD